MHSAKGRTWCITGMWRVRTCTYAEVLWAFAGEDWQAAVIDPSEEHLLQETSISHYATPDAD